VLDNGALNGAFVIIVHGLEDELESAQTSVDGLPNCCTLLRLTTRAQHDWCRPLQFHGRKAVRCSRFSKST
jgi:hypothetical protein